VKTRLLIGLFVLAGGLSAGAAESDTVTVENAHVRIVFGTQPVPALRELVQKPAGSNLAAILSSPLFVLQVAQSNGISSVIESQQAKRGTIEVTPIRGGQSIRMTFGGLGPLGDLQVSIEGWLDDAEPFVRWSITVANPSRLHLKAVRFPFISAVPAIGSPDDDFLIGPALPGVMIENPNANWPAQHSISWTFPGEQSAQFCAYQDRTAGVYLASRDTVGY